ncbi:hypothetical protein AMELA_G00165540 [Ameiurus melas]|uniref:Uncharacterized protein n=1 Tax=Ameiurus melas TaxID=219545 RepID=A0A7J6AEV9_AMEME|nr:hypothetical protein AMELA_G00165540 [Ameiurus melas]
MPSTPTLLGPTVALCNNAATTKTKRARLSEAICAVKPPNPTVIGRHFENVSRAKHRNKSSAQQSNHPISQALREKILLQKEVTEMVDFFISIVIYTSILLH